MSTEDMLSQLSRFFSSYLSCSEEQLTILSLWTLHTHCFAAAQTTPYLDISSTEWQSGKTVCLRLLSLVCAGPWLATGINSTILVRKLTASRPTLLLDERETIFSSAAYGKIRGLLINGAHRGGTFSVASGSKPVQDLDIFCPKAFAGNTPLPAALSHFCIPIILLRNDDYGYFNKLRLSQAREAAQPLFHALQNWAAEHLDALKNAPPFSFDSFEDGFESRQEDCVEPLFQIARLLGEEWPLKLHTALCPSLRKHYSENQHAWCVQVLADILDFFSVTSCQRLSTDEILGYLNLLEERPWSQWNDGRPMTARTLARLLRRTGVYSRSQRHDSGKRGRGYDAKDFETQWQCWLPQDGTGAEEQTEEEECDAESSDLSVTV